MDGNIENENSFYESSVEKSGTEYEERKKSDVFSLIVISVLDMRSKKKSNCWIS